MDRIRDLTDTDGRTDELVTSTSGGLFETQYLSEGSPATYLESYEQPQYALRNKKSGVSIGEAGSDRTQRPDSNHQALAIVSDCRLLYLVGLADGDHFESVRHDEIVEARAERSGFLKSVLLVETVDGKQFRFACRGDISEVAAFVDDAAQTWANASRLTDEASDQLETSREFLEAGAFTDARDVLEGVSQNVRMARERVSIVGDGATEALESRASDLIERLRQLEQEIAATKGAHHHAAAQDAWKTDHDFEQAAEEYEQGAAEYERALAAEGTVPSNEALQLRLKGLVKEREVLRAAPMADAKAAREVAMTTDDPDEAAAEWETALTCYREAVTLDWGEREGGFVVDRDRARERASEVTTEAIEAHVEAGETWATAGDKIVRNGRKREARQAYDRAEDHFERAQETARELAPERIDNIAALLDALEKRRSGEVVPAGDSAETTLPVAAVADQLSDTDRHHRDGNRAEHDSMIDEDAETTASAADETTPAIRHVDADECGETSATAETRPADRNDGSVEPTPAIRRHTESSGRESIEQDRTTASTGMASDSSVDSVTERKTYIEADHEPTAAESTPDSLVSALRELDEAALTELVAELWEATGWSATVFSATTETVYDIVALRDGDGEDERLLLWTVHRPDDGALGKTVVRRCATTRDSSHGADQATVVTTGTFTSGARASAEKRDVTVVDGEDLANRLAEAGLADRLV